jgi:Protein of unknown function (DUF 659)
MAIFANARPFTLFDDPFLLDFLNAMKQDYRLPSRTTISNSLLSQCYSMVKKKVDGQIGGLKYINLSADETTNIRGQRIMNLSLSTPDRSYYIVSDDMKDLQLTATNIASWIIDKVAGILGPDVSGWSKVNSFTSDTCNTMKAVWPIIQSTAGLEHVFCIGCDSHSLQLLMKDLLSLPG